MKVMGHKKPVLMPGATLAEAEAELAERRRQDDKDRKLAAKQALENKRIDAAIEEALPGRVAELVARYAKDSLEGWPGFAAVVLGRAQLENELRQGGMSSNPPPPALYPDYIRRVNQLPS